MAVLKRGQFKHPALARETVEVPALGGEVVVRGMLLSERLAFAEATSSAGDADGTVRFSNLARVLSWCVLDADNEPLMTRDEWEAFGSVHLDACVQLFNQVQRHSLLTQEDVEKKS